MGVSYVKVAAMDYQNPHPRTGTPRIYKGTSAEDATLVQVRTHPLWTSEQVRLNTPKVRDISHALNTTLFRETCWKLSKLSSCVEGTSTMFRQPICRDLTESRIT